MTADIMTENYSAELLPRIRLWFKFLSVNEILISLCSPSICLLMTIISNHMFNTSAFSLKICLCFPKCTTQQKHNRTYFYIAVCALMSGDGWSMHALTHMHRKILTVMYLTSMSVFLSSSDMISLWNLLNFR